MNCLYLKRISSYFWLVILFFSSFLFKLKSSKTACSKLESELKQEQGNTLDLRKLLTDERNVMSTMDMEHQQQLVELEQRHQEKVGQLERLRRRTFIHSSAR